MKSPRLILLAITLLFLTPVFAQPICGFDASHKKLMEESPTYRKNVLDQQAYIKAYVEAHKNQPQLKADAPIYIIPVVVHIIHTGGAIGTIYNPSDAQIQGAMAYLNAIYDGTHGSLTGGVGDLQIQFVLAQRDPNCNPTNGINRVNGSGVSGYTANGMNHGTAGADELTIKNLSRWDRTQYYNIWIVNKIDGADGTSGQFVAGFAYFPTTDPRDGTVMLATQMVNGEKTLPHEIGHAFSLQHTFGASNLFSTCGDDGVADTDPCSQNRNAMGVNDFSCRTGANACNGGAPFAINTESNFMSYTNCYTLFTAGQKTVMHAAAGGSFRSSLNSSAGATPTDAGTPCTPKINFEFTEGSAAETTTGTSGCRSYTDYTYNLTIGANPSVATTATLNVSAGTATEGVDFDVTTNGNFAAPSKVLNFPTGTHINRAFTIRIYNDAIVDGTESFTLAFTVNNGGGNAVLGNGRPNLTFTITDNDVAPVGPSNITATLGTSAGTFQSPFAGANARQKSQLLYKASELTAAGVPAGNITGLNLNIVKASGAAFVYTGLTIKMGHTTQSSMYNGTTEFPVNDLAGFTTVYSSNYTTTNGLNNFTFTTPFVWNGTSNIVVVICYDNGVTTSNNDNVTAYTDGSAFSNYVFQNTINCGGTFSSFSLFNSGFKPVIQFVYPDPGTQVQTTLNTSKSEYLGPNADIYFYDQTNNQLMARIRNLSSHDYGCTQVTLDRAGTGSTAFWNNNTTNYLATKTFRVVPTTNNASGNYQITLYYTQNEINTWQSATTLGVGSAQMVKVANQILNVTPGNPTGGGTAVTATPVITTVGTNTAVTATFSNGFSGFGIGLPGFPLPIKLVDFKARLKGDNVTLDWSTSSEANSRSFEIERSYDGSKFIKVGTLAAAGNSNTLRSYVFADPEIAQENNYYRLKQVDLDGKSEYSKVVQVKNPQRFGKFKVLTNPFINTVDIEMGKGILGTIEVRLLDMTGKELYRSLNDGNGQSRMRINLSGRNISAGIYLLEVRTNNERYTERLMKQ